jgi:hypothetical protein
LLPTAAQSAKAPLPTRCSPRLTNWKRKSEAATAAKEPHHDQQQNGTNRRIDDFRNKPGTKVHAELGKQETGDQGACDANENISS